MTKKFGFSWSWKRALGLQKIRQDISRNIALPTTRYGLERKLGSLLLRFLFGKK
jgi:hypothetical protein